MKIYPVTIGYNTRVNNKVVSHSNIAFKGIQYSFGYFTDKEIQDTYKYMKYSDSEWRYEAQRDFIDQCPFFKYVFGGGAEDIEKHLNEMEKLRKGLKAQELENARKQEELKKQALELEKQRIKLEKLREKQALELEKQRKLQPYKDFFNNEFYNLIELETQGNEVQIPNAILIEKEDAKTNNKINEWIEKSTQVDVRKINPLHTNESITEANKKLSLVLTEAQDNYSKNNKRTLLMIDNFDYWTTEGNYRQCIATFKALMCECAEKYKCTFLLNLTKEQIKKIDPILLVDSRVQARIKI